MKKHIVFDPERCCACSACTIACIDQNDIDVRAGALPYRKAFDLELERLDGGYDFACLSASCMHCDEAPCILACPSGCLSKDLRTGMTVYNNTRCIGCRSCAMACPFGAPRFREDGKMVKCDGCSERVAAGLQPACVRACTFDALRCVSEAEYRRSAEQKSAFALLKTLSALHP